MKPKIRICGCLHPIELPNMKCGACGKKRLGDDISPQQLDDLTDVLSKVLETEEPSIYLHRYHGRKRQPWRP